jgi:hypothetical protein
VSGIQTSLASVIVRYLIFSADEKDRKNRLFSARKRDFFSVFQLNYHFLVKRTPEEESGMIHPEGLTIKKMSEIDILCRYFGRPKNLLMADLVAFRIL